MKRTPPKTIAFILACGGSLWAALLSFFALGQSLWIFYVFAPGFLVWGGWILRASPATLRLSIRRLIWIGSIAYNAFYLIRVLNDRVHTPILYPIWWGLAAGLSAVAIFLERKETVSRPTTVPS